MHLLKGWGRGECRTYLNLLPCTWWRLGKRCKVPPQSGKFMQTVSPSLVWKFTSVLSFSLNLNVADSARAQISSQLYFLNCCFSHFYYFQLRIQNKGKMACSTNRYTTSLQHLRSKHVHCCLIWNLKRFLPALKIERVVRHALPLFFFMLLCILGGTMSYLVEQCHTWWNNVILGGTMSLHA
jgi:hypothetical protein